ncbi:hypothetical protein BC938DRAFT_484037 [Jimgerdemannia flammicorona]|uniref:RGS domain-containing protein n=1 Tax=Jimgerdemannia flammicorona TaxID=994334 RepID=A0A433QAU6_9FUNG|nr:hypothetical protein BC938DRAFT_484037 [Jimgerdemannia flammicorona]
MSYVGYVKHMGVFSPYPTLAECADLLAEYFPNKPYDVDTECAHARDHIIAARVSLAFSVLNGLFIIITTALFLKQSYQWKNTITLDRRKSDSDSPEHEHEHDRPKYRRKGKRIPTERVVGDKFLFRRLALLKRSVAPTVLAAVGHIIVSTTFALLESFDKVFPCYVVLWASYIGFFCWIYSFVWRALRLRFLIRLHKQRLTVKLSENDDNLPRQGIRNPQPRPTRPEDRALPKADASSLGIVRWRFFPVKENINTYSEKRFLIVFGIILLLLIGFLAVTQHYTTRFALDVTICNWGWEQYLLMLSLSLFVAVVCPISMWLIWGHRDANGIREDIMTTIIGGIPAYVLYFIWLTVFPDGYTPGDTMVRVYWGASKWPVMFMMVSHFTSVVIPMLKSYGIDYKRWGESMREERIKVWCKSAAEDCSANLESNIETTSHNSLKPSLSLTVESLNNALDDPDLFQRLRDFTVKDFCSENSLFLEQYKLLIARVDAFYQLDARHLRTDLDNLKPHNYPYGNLTPFLVSLESIISAPSNPSSPTFSSFSYSTDNIPNVHPKRGPSPIGVSGSQAPNRLVPTPLIHEFVRFYYTFIRGGAPLQVNLEATTLAQIAAAMSPYVDDDGIDMTDIPDSITTIASASSPLAGTVRAGSEDLCRNDNNSRQLWQQALNHSVDTMPARQSMSLKRMSPTSPPYRGQRRTTATSLISNTTTLALSPPETPFGGSQPISPTMREFGNDATDPDGLSVTVFDEARDEVFWDMFFNTWPKFVLSIRS